MLAPLLTPHGLLTLAPSPDAADEKAVLEPARGARLEGLAVYLLERDR